MHRSGTSALARVLSLLGCGLPDNLMPAIQGNNETGFWESRDIAKFNDDLLHSAGSYWDDWGAMPEGWFNSPATNTWRLKAQEVLRNSFAEQPFVVLKDPRICRLLPFWLETLKIAGYQSRLIMPLRHPLEVASSLRKRDGFSQRKGQVLWLRHVLDAERDSRHQKRALIKYEDLLEDWRSVLRLVNQQLDLNLPRWSATAELEVDDFLRDDLRHNQAPPEIAHHTEVPNWIKQAYPALLGLAKPEPDTDQSEKILDAIRVDFDDATRTFGSILRNEERALKEVEKQFQLAKAELEQNARTISAISEHSQFLEADRARLLSESENQQGQIVAANSQIASLRAQSTHLTRVLTRNNQRASRWRQLFATTQEHLDLLKRAEPAAHWQVRLLRQALQTQRGATALRLRDSVIIREAASQVEDQLYQQASTAQRATTREMTRHADISKQLAQIHGMRSWRLIRLFLATERQLPLLAQWFVALPHLLLGAARFQFPRRLRALREQTCIRSAKLFDTAFYLTQIPELPESRTKPLKHYIACGASEGRNPHPLFMTTWYLKQLPESTKIDINPLVHFINNKQSRTISPHPVFDAKWYLQQNTDVAESECNPLLHFLEHGASQSRDPHPLFSCAWYLQQYPDIAAAGVNPLIHYLKEGWKEAREPHPFFKPDWYLKKYPDVAESGLEPLTHFLSSGASEGRLPHPLFKTDWYVAKSLEIEQGANPLVHFIEYGANIDRDPHPLFASQWYKEKHPGVKQSTKGNALLHYLCFGEKLGFNPHPLFDAQWYARRYQDIEAMPPFQHFLEYGEAEGRQPHPLFDSVRYRAAYAEEEILHPLQHYLTKGANKDPHPLFDSQWYFSDNPDVASAGLNPLFHFVVWGAAQGRSPHPLFNTSWYLQTYPDVPPDINGLIHYLEYGANDSRNPHALFDTTWYLQQHPSLVTSGMNPLLDYLANGYKPGADPHPLFDTNWYLERNPDAHNSGANPLCHYIRTGGPEERDPHPLFCTQYYFASDPQLRALVAEAKITPLEHYLTHTSERSPHPLFNGAWYLEQYPELLAAGQNPLLHFIKEGAAAGYFPNPLFDSHWYFSQASGLSELGINPLVHYLQTGSAQGLDPCLLFDTSWYLERNPGILEEGINPLEHYLRWGAELALDPHPLFSANWYLEHYPDLREPTQPPLIHFIRWGGAEGRSPHPLFDSAWYLEQYPDVEEALENPLAHYLRCGAAEGRNPHPLFQTAWYLSHQKELLETKENPLIHFIRIGASEGLKPNPWFDTAWYLERYPEVKASGVNPLVHYLQQGTSYDYNPGRNFDNKWYLETYPDAAESGLAPLVHYLRIGMAEARKPNQQALLPTQVKESHGRLYDQMLRSATSGYDRDDYVPADNKHLASETLAVRAIAFYLPQFHPIPENDAWWGKGFTEWTNVAKAVPQFDGHYQPRQPEALGFYDLRVKAVQAEQVRLARQHGIHGFCYYYYWFGGRRLLEQPLLQMLADQQINFPFCLCWANENWTRSWDGGDSTILIGQRHSAADDIAFFDSITPALLDRRYIRINGRPLLLVYRPQLLPDPAATVSRWREQARQSGVGDLHLAAVRSFTDALDHKAYGFDSGVDFPPHHVEFVEISAHTEFLNQQFTGRIYDYQACTKAAEFRYNKDIDSPGVIPGVMLAWDNTARRGSTATIFARATPQAYGRWLEAACTCSIRKSNRDERIVFINAWNEWAEGTYLEPDRRYGYAWLQKTREVLAQVSGTETLERISSPKVLDKASPALLFVGHDALRHGAQLLTMHLLRVFRKQFGCVVHLWLLGDGDLLDAYRNDAADIQIFRGISQDVAYAAQRLAKAGVKQAIVNTVVSAAVLPQLSSNNLRSLSLIHEMPELIRERGLETNATLCATHADTLIFASERVRQAFATLVDLPLERSIILPQGIYQSLACSDAERTAIEAELSLPADAILVINIGFGDKRKGLDLFLECARVTTMADARFHFLWVGNIEQGLDGAFEQARASEPLSRALHHVPFTPEVSRYYAAANLFLLTSREDPFPSVVLEALCCGLPVIAFADTGGHCDLLSPPECPSSPLGGETQSPTHVPNGQLITPVGDVEALSLALQQSAAAEAQHPEWAQLRAAAARSRFNFVDYAWQLLTKLDPSLCSVSILVPNYNYASYIHERLQSLFAQDYPVFEIIVLDDASTDGSEAVIHECVQNAGRNVRLITNSKNSGSVFVQWARGAREARGDLIWIAEADDLAQPEFLSRLAPLFAENPELCLSFCDSQQIDQAGRCLGDSYADYCNEHSDLDFRANFRTEAAEFIRQGLSVKNTVLNVSSVLFRRETLLAAMQTLGWLTDRPTAEAETEQLPDWHIAGDWRLYIEICRAGGEVQYCAEPLNAHRRHQSSVVGRHQLSEHAEEIGRMHRLLRPDIGADQRIADRQYAYLKSIKDRAMPDMISASAI